MTAAILDHDVRNAHVRRHNDGHASRKRFGRRDAEAFERRRHDQNVDRGEELAFRRVLDETVPPDAGFDPT